MRVTRFSDLSYEEKAKLIDEQVKDFIKVECAYTGVKLLPEPIPPIKPEMGEKTDYFRIGWNNDMTFLNLEDAEKVLKVLKTCDMVNTKYEGDSGEYSHVSNITKYSGRIKTESFYTAEQHEVNRDALIIYKKQKDAYDILLKEWNKSDIAVSKVQDNIYEEMQRIWKLEHTRTMLTGEFKIYLKMAKGDNQIALSFLRNSWDKEMGELEKGFSKGNYTRFLKTLADIKLKK